MKVMPMVVVMIMLLHEDNDGSVQPRGGQRHHRYDAISNPLSKPAESPHPIPTWRFMGSYN